MTSDEILLLKRRAEDLASNSDDDLSPVGPVVAELLAYITLLETQLDLTQHWLTVRSSQWQVLDNMRRAPVTEQLDHFATADMIGRNGAAENESWPKIAQAAESRHRGYLHRRRAALDAIKFAPTPMKPIEGDNNDEFNPF